MVRINLLPPEIQERRRWDRYYPLVFIVAAVLFVAIAATALGLFWYTNNERAVLQDYKSQSAQLQSQAEQFSVFEEKETELTRKQSLSQQALDGRINWASIGRDMSLVCPDEVWFISMLGNEDTGMQLSGYTPNSDPKAPSESYKSIAKMLVLLNSLPELYDLWLTSATAAEYSDGTSNATAPALQFQATAKVVKPSSSATSTAQPTASQ